MSIGNEILRQNFQPFVLNSSWESHLFLPFRFFYGIKSVLYCMLTRILFLLLHDNFLRDMGGIIGKFFRFIFAQLLSNYIDVTDSLRHSLTGRLALSVISQLLWIDLDVLTFFTVLPPKIWRESHFMVSFFRRGGGGCKFLVILESWASDVLVDLVWLYSQEY